MKKLAHLRWFMFLGLLTGLLALLLSGQTALLNEDPSFQPSAHALARAQETQIASPLGSRSKTFSLPAAEAVGAIRQFSETSFTISDLDFVSAETGYAVGWPHWDQSRKEVRGTIIKTSDGGENWTAQESPVSEPLNAVSFSDADHGWAVGTNGTILHTSNGGDLWQKQSAASREEFLSVTFPENSSGWATSVKPIHFDTQGRADNWQAAVWHTSDGGQSWAMQTMPAGAAILRGLSFISTQTGWVVGSKYNGDDQYGRPQHIAAVYQTSNGGSTWQEQYAPQLEVSLTSAHFIDANHGWTAGFPTNSGVEGGFVLHTKNGGQSWERQEPGGFYSPLWDIHFIDSQRGYVVGANYIGAWGPPVYRTFDGGATWENIRMKRHENDGLFGLDVTAERVIALGDHDLQIFSTTPWDPYPEPTGEQLFEQRFINTHYRFEDVFFADDQNGWAVGSRSYFPEMSGQVILHTQDGGATWAQQYEHAPDLTGLFSYHRLNSLYFIDNQNGWAVGTSETFRGSGGWEHKGAILHTGDGGQTWQEQGQELYEDRSREFFAVQFLDSQNGWAVATRKFPSSTIHLVQTTDGGLNWRWVDTGIEGPLSIGYRLVQGDVHFTDAQHGWAAGGLGKVIATSDGGKSWEQQQLSCIFGYPDCPWRTYALDFIDNDHGWLAGEGVFQTTDGGKEWPERVIAKAGDIQDVQFFSSGTGWMVSDRGQMLYTNNNGRRWHQLPPGANAPLRGLSFTSRTQGWMAGEQGTIYHFSADRLPIETEILFPIILRLS